MTKKQLRDKILKSLISQGFSVNGHIVPQSLSKNHFRQIQTVSKKEQIRLQKDFLLGAHDIAEKFLINGSDIDPAAIDLELRTAEEGSTENMLFRWWNLVWWSVPYQRAYGRQMRFVLWDKTHDAPFGLIGLQSPRCSPI